MGKARLTASPYRLFGFFVHRMLAAVLAEFLQLQFVLEVRVLVGKIIDALAFAALKFSSILCSRHNKIISLLVREK